MNDPQPDIAVVGLAGRFPGAPDVGTFWQNLRDGVDGISRLQEDELVRAGVSRTTLDDPRFVPAWGRLDDADLFDAQHFGYSRREASLMDPQQRVMLEVAWHALEDAGHVPDRFDGRIGVYAGTSMSTYLLEVLLRGRGLPPGPEGLELLVANDKDYLASRVSYKLGLTGPAVCVQSACSTSLLAVHLACQALLDDECDMALAGGVTVRFPQDTGYLHTEGMILSPDGRCRPFDAQAAGTVAGSGAGLVVLRRLADALADGDRIDAVIRGSAANNDGAAKVGYTAPSVTGQAAVVRAALDAAGLRAGDLGAIEAHGTGTQLGDPVEVAALAKVWSQDAPVAPGSVVIGSVKSNIGHLDCAAGVASLIKAVLQVRHGELVPTLHYADPNPQIDLTGSPFRVAGATAPWQPEGPRRIGVSAFGFGGTNVHVVLEQAPDRPTGAQAPRPLLVPVSARTEEALTAQRAAVARAVAAEPALAAAALTLQQGRTHGRWRDAVVAATPTEAAAALAAPPRRAARAVPSGRGATVWLLPGQGAQRPGMAGGLFAADAGFAADVERCLELFGPRVEGDLRGLLLDPPDADGRASAALARTALAQPALFTVEWALARLLERWGVRRAAMVGHSVGELTAACLAGVMDLPDAVRVVAARGRLLEALPGGTMLSVAADAARVSALLPDGVEVAADNGPRLCVVAGPSEAVARFAATLDVQDVAHRPLVTSHAFHSAAVEPAMGEFREVVASVRLSPPRRPYVTAVTGETITASQATDPEHYVRHLRRPVLFGPALRRALALPEVGALVEVGPGTALASIARSEPAAAGLAVVATMPAGAPAGGAGADDDLRTLLAAVGELWSAGTDVAWEAFAPATTPGAPRRTALPGTSFGRRRYWLDDAAGEAGDPTDDARTADVAPPAGDPAAESVAATPDAPRPAPARPDDRPDLGTAYEAPRTAMERCVAGVWEDLLEVAPIGRDDAFVEMGGNSLVATKVVASLARLTGVEVPLRRLVGAATVEALAAVVTELGGRAPGADADARVTAGTDDDALPRAVPDPDALHEPFPLSEIQQVQWLGRLSSFALGNVGAHMYWEVDATDLDLAALGAALQRLVERHAMLRAVIREDGMQQVLPDVGPYVIDVTDLRDAEPTRRDDHLARLRDGISHEMRPLDRWPLFDVRAVLLPGGVTRLFLSFELVMADMGSVRILLRDWRALYEHPERELPPLALSFRDYQLAAARAKETPRYRRSLQYWKERVAQLPPAPDLPLAVAPEDIDAPRFTPRTARVEREVWNRVTARAAGHGLTASTVLLAVYAMVLGRWSRGAAFTLNVTSNVRLPLHEEVDDIAGGFASFGLLPVDLTGGPSVLDVARALQERSWEDLEHRWVNGVDVLRELARVRGDASGALMPVVFTSTLVNTVGEDRTSMVDWLGELEHEIIQTPQVWLDAAALQVEAGLVLGFPAVDGLFREGVVDAMFAAYLDLVTRLGAPDDTSAWSDHPDLLPPADRELAARCNATAGPVPEGLLHSAVVAQALARPDDVAVVDAHGQTTFGELYSRACGLAWQLRELGVGPGQRVGIVLDKSTEQVVAALGVLLAGAAYLPVDASAPPARQNQVLELGRCRVALASTGDDRVRPAGVEVLRVPQGAGGPRRDDAPRWVGDAGDTAYVIFTSGSTGTPKGVVMSHRAALNTCVDVDERFGVGPQDAVLGLSSLGFDLSVWDVFGVLGAGGRLVLPAPAERRDPGRWLELVRTHGVTVWNSVPALMQMLVEHAEGAAPGGEPTGLRLALLSGDWVPVDLADRVRAVAPGCRVVSLGGATEAGIWSVAFEIGTTDPAWDSVPYGTPLRNQTLHVLDHDLAECPVQVTGELYIGGAGLADGYWDDPERTAAAFVVHPATGERLYRTGDLVRRRPDGVLEFLGRVDTQVKVGGYRIELGEIEAAAVRHPAVLAAVAAATGGRHHRRLVAGVVLAPDATADAPADEVLADVVAYLGRVLPPYMVPTTTALLPAVPLSANGKVDRDRAVDLLGGAGQTAPTAPRPALTAAAQRLAAIACEVLGVTEVDPWASFFELGGDSIAGVRVVNRAVRDGMPVVLQDLFEATSVAGLGALVEERDAQRDVVLAQEDAPLTPWQVRLASAGHGGAGVFRVEIPVPADACAEVVRSALQHVTQAHDALRTRVVDDGDGTPRQVVVPVGEEADVPVVDLGVLDAGRRDAAVDEVVAQLCDELALATGPVARVVLLDLGPDGRRLLWVLHEVVVDGPSCRVLADDLLRATLAVAAGEAPPAHLGEDSFAAWASEQRAACDAGAPPPALPPGAVAAVTWDRIATSAMVEAAWRSDRAEPTDLLLAALAHAEPTAPVVLVADGREAVTGRALRRTAGAFGQPVRVPEPAGTSTDLLDVLRDAKRRRRDALHRRDAADGSEEGVVLHLVDGRRLDAPDGPVVLEHVPGAARTHRRAVTAGLSAGRLRLVVTADGQDEAHDLATRLVTALGEIAHRCDEAEAGAGARAADFPVSGLDDDELAGLLAALGEGSTR
ncbi:MAG: amino acid adenylation domain-containing protein [Cellulomonas sp.]|uniref:non-ribosomal peptide synthetase/type I polyketide synthase n=1 Tax=Cellulomonas sp. TaxID=40001 RepID=UPI0019DB3AC0|nr:non-ribosomal peptide synthetase/type I polyketide synthase [Cellulomonas sp.]MBF0688237.1 amino acid adenylation domain-containing protein [Cellulomonas sp.]